MDNQETYKAFEALRQGAENYIVRRNNAYKKEVRYFTRIEASNYLSVDGKTVDKYVKMAGIDPNRHEDAAWLIDINEMYQVRELLPLDKRIEHKFTRPKNHKLQVIVVQNQKGGVGKTISAATIASGLATEFHEEFRVGVIDLDPQNTLSTYYAPIVEGEENQWLSVGDLMAGKFEMEEDETFSDVVSESFLQTTIPNLRILPATQDDRSLENWFHRQLHNQSLDKPYHLLKNIIDAVENEFDIIIIDTPPSMGFATINGYFAATSVIFPMQVAENDIDATCNYFKFIPELWELIDDHGHTGYDFMKILLTNHKTSSSTTTLQNKLSNVFGSFIYSREFNNSEAIKECSRLVSTLFDISKSEYPGRTKSVFQKAKDNAYEVTSQVYRNIVDVWDKDN